MKEITFEKYQEYLINSFKRIQNAFEKEGIFWFAHSGTLLGAAREGKIIPWDDDIDMGMFSQDFFERKDKIEEICEQNNMKLFDPSDTWGLDVARIFSNETYIVDYEGGKFVAQVYIDIMIAVPVKKISSIRDMWFEIANKYSWIYGNFYNILPKKGWIKNEIKDIGWLRNMFVFISKVITFPFLFWIPIYQNKRVKSAKNYNKHQFFYCWNNKRTFYTKNKSTFVKLKFNGIDINVVKDYEKYLSDWYGESWKNKPAKNSRAPHNLLLTPYSKDIKYVLRPFLIK